MAGGICSLRQTDSLIFMSSYVLDLELTPTIEGEEEQARTNKVVASYPSYIVVDSYRR